MVLVLAPCHWRVGTMEYISPPYTMNSTGEWLTTVATAYVAALTAAIAAAIKYNTRIVLHVHERVLYYKCCVPYISYACS